MFRSIECRLRPCRPDRPPRPAARREIPWPNDRIRPGRKPPKNSCHVPTGKPGGVPAEVTSTPRGGFGTTSGRVRTTPGSGPSSGTTGPPCWPARVTSTPPGTASGRLWTSIPTAGRPASTSRCWRPMIPSPARVPASGSLRRGPVRGRPGGGRARGRAELPVQLALDRRWDRPHRRAGPIPPRGRLRGPAPLRPLRAPGASVASRSRSPIPPRCWTSTTVPGPCPGSSSSSAAPSMPSAPIMSSSRTPGTASRCWPRPCAATGRSSASRPASASAR